MTASDVDAAIVSELDRQGCAYGGIDTERLANALVGCVRDRSAELRQALQMWRGLVIEGGVPRYTVMPGAALNTVVTWTDAVLAGGSQ